MPAIDQVVSINISQQTQAVAQPSFSIPLILARKDPGWPAAEIVHTYSDAAGMLDDGFVAEDLEYVYAQAMYSQSPTPSQFKVARRGTVTLQESHMFVDALIGAGQFYKFKINGVQIKVQASPANPSTDFWGGKIAEAVQATGLVDATFDPDKGVVLIGKDEAPFTITDLNLNEPLPNGDADTVTAALSVEQVTAASGLPATLARAMADDPDWYGLTIAGATDTEILTAAPWVEANRKLFVSVTATAGVAGGATNDVGSQLKTGAFKRTALLFAPAGRPQGIDAAWLASQLAQTPGSNTWAFKSLNGISADKLTSTQSATCIGNPVAGVAGKNVNIYQTVGGLNVTQMGVTSSGQFIDLTVGLDWLHVTLQTNVYQALVGAKKIPYTDAGTAILISAVRAAIDQGIANGLIDGDSDLSVTAPPVTSISLNQRAQRIAPTITFTCRLQGAFHAVSVQGTVTV